MIQRAFSWSCRGLAVALTVVASTLALSAPARAQVVAVVNGSPITNLDVEQRTKLDSLGGRKPPSRQEVLQSLIDDKIKISVAKTFSLEATDSELEAAFTDMARRGRMTPEQLAQQLAASGTSAAALKARIRADIVWGQLVRGRFGSALQVGERDIAAAIKPEEKQVGYVYTLRPIVLVVPRGSEGTVVEARRRDADALRTRFEGCEEGVRFARQMRDVAIRDPITRSSADLSPELRQLLESMPLGKLTTPEPTPQGWQMFALCAKKESADDAPGKKEAREQLFAKRFETQAKKYLEEERKRAMIEYR